MKAVLKIIHTIGSRDVSAGILLAEKGVKISKNSPGHSVDVILRDEVTKIRHSIPELSSLNCRVETIDKNCCENFIRFNIGDIT